MEQRELAWRNPWRLTRALAAALGSTGLVLLDGDDSPLGDSGVLGVEPLDTIRCDGLPGEAGASDPFAALADAVARQAAVGGAWLGWLGYEAGAWVEPAGPWQRPDTASLWAVRHDPLIHFRRSDRRLWLAGHDGARLRRLAALIDRLAPPGDTAADPGPPLGLAAEGWHWHTPPGRYAEQVARLRRWIAAGDLFQANLTACCERQLTAAADPLAFYAHLRQRCPAPFSGLAVAGEEAVLSASPERFLRLSADGWVETRPIKGTRPRFAAPEADADSAAQLVSDPKDRAENVMIVDLLRNDLGRVCQPGSIAVPQLVGLESYAQVHHLTSVVTGRLRPGLGVVDLLRACWPGGSITGAPKVRACQRLSELEPVPRGPYCGSLFHLGADGSFDSSILIRTLLLRGQRLRAHAGGGIVTDSDPAAEAEEMGWKIRPLLEALA
ncbi:MAG: anthranilate synthase component I family protein [Cyanobacteriota bacterium]|jgi:para-aminobenzoate synthetase component 1|nr:anthranilate synthase component I family protein [Cyanobacteriota bacterium]